MWDLLLKELTQLAALRDRHATNIVPHRKLPVEYEEEFFHFDTLVVRLRTVSMMNLQSAIYGSPPLRNHFVYTQEGRTIHVKRKNPKRPDYLLWLIEMITDETDVKNLGMENLLDELERVMRDGAHGSTLHRTTVSQHLYRMLCRIWRFSVRSIHKLRGTNLALECCISRDEVERRFERANTATK